MTLSGAINSKVNECLSEEQCVYEYMKGVQPHLMEMPHEITYIPLGEYKSVRESLASSLAWLCKVESNNPCTFVVLLLDIFPFKNAFSKIYIKKYRATLFVISPNWKQPRCPGLSGKINCNIFIKWNKQTIATYNYMAESYKHNV